VRAKGAIPIVGIKTPQQAIETNNAIQWDLDEEDVSELDRVALDVYRKRKRIKELISGGSGSSKRRRGRRD